jgi:pimeloyl-ACP methyl ester carboxylesterase
MKWTLRRAVAAIALASVALPAQSAGVAGRDRDAAPMHVAGQKLQVEEVRIPSEPEVVLAGALRIPRGPGPYPVVLLLAGSGPNERGAFDLLIDKLVDQGIAALDYDKRGTGRSTGIYVDDFALIERDAEAAIAYLRARPDIDNKRIAIGGVSHGAGVALAVAGRDPAISAVVMLAGPVGAPEGVFLALMRTKLQSAGMQEKAIVGLLAATKGFMDARTSDTKLDGIAPLREDLAGAFMAGGFTRAQADGVIAEFETPEVLSIYKLNPYATLTKLRVPVLALFASLDKVIGTNEPPIARRALARNLDATVIEVAGINHWFQPSATVEPQAGRPLSEPKVIELIENWLTTRLHAGDKRTAQLRR